MKRKEQALEMIEEGKLGIEDILINKGLIKWI